MEQNNRKIFEEEVVESLLLEIETSILKKKEEIKGIVSKSIQAIGVSPRTALYGDVNNETIDRLEQYSKEIADLIPEIQKLQNLHKYVKLQRNNYSFFFTAWIDREVLRMNDLNEYIEKNFTKKELEKDDK